MDDDFRITVSAKSAGEEANRATGLHDLFKKEIEELGSSDPDWFTNAVGERSSVKEEKKIQSSVEFPAHSNNSTTDEDGISSSVRNLLNLIVERAAAHGNRIAADINGAREASPKEDKTYLADESWSSSMATPSGSNLSALELNNSAFINTSTEMNGSGNDNNTTAECDVDFNNVSHNEEEYTVSKVGFLFNGVNEPIVDSIQGLNALRRESNVHSSDKVSMSEKDAISLDIMESKYLHNILSPSDSSLIQGEMKNEVGKTCTSLHTESQSLKTCLALDSINEDIQPCKSYLCTDTDKNISIDSLITNEFDNKESLPSQEVRKYVCSGINRQNSEGTDLIEKTDLEKDTFVGELVKDELEVVDCGVSLPQAKINYSPLGESSVCSVANGNCEITEDLKVEATEVPEPMVGEVDAENEEFIREKVVVLNIRNDPSFFTGNRIHENSQLDFGSNMRNTKKEPEYVSQILDLLCSPINTCATTSESAIQKICELHSEDSKRVCLEKESEYVVREIMADLLDKIQEELARCEKKSIEINVNTFSSRAPTDCVSEHNHKKNPKHDNNISLNTVNENAIKAGIISEEKNVETRDISSTNNVPTSNFLHPAINLWSDNHCASEFLKSSPPRQDSVLYNLVEQNIASVKDEEGVPDPKTSEAPKDGGVSLVIDLQGGQNMIPISCGFKGKMASNEAQPVVGESNEAEPENDSESCLNYSATQDFLSCSVLEEVCQASEAVAYIGKVKSDCFVIHESKDEPRSSEECYKKMEDNSCMGNVGTNSGVNMKIVCSIKEREDIGINYSRRSNNFQFSDDAATSCTTVRNDSAMKTKSGDKRECTLIEGSSSLPRAEKHSHQLFKKRIIFTIPQCNALEVDLGNEDTSGAIQCVRGECSGANTDIDIIFPPKYTSLTSNEVSSCSYKERCIEPKKHDWPKGFMYPKRASQQNLSRLLPVLPEDLMSSAAQLEKHSCILRNGDKSHLTGLKTESLVSFSNMETIPCHDTSEVITDLSTANNACKNGTYFNHQNGNAPGKEVCSHDTNAWSDGIEKEEEYTANTLDNKNILGRIKVTTDRILNESKVTDDEDINNIEPLSSNTPLGPLDTHPVSQETKVPQQKTTTEETGAACTSPILMKKVKTKKPFRRRMKIKCSGSLPATKVNVKEMMNVESEFHNTGKTIDIHKSVSSDNYMRINQENQTNTLKGAGLEDEGILGFQNESMLDPSGMTNLFEKDTKGSQEFMSNLKSQFSRNTAPFRSCNISGPSIRCGETEGTSDKSLVKEVIDNGNSTPITAEPEGFTTVSSKRVSVEESSLERAKKLFSEDVTPLRSNENTGFSTASGKKVDVSEKSLLRAKMLFSEETSTPVRSDPQGFTTASGKRVSVTESSLERAKKLFSEDVTPLRSSENTGFSTASGKKVDVSEKSLLRAKMLFSEETSTPVRSDPQGFTTASGKRVSVTESSLERAKKLFSEDVTPLRSSENTGFSTASGKKVDVSEKSLLRAKMLFSEETSTPVRSDPQGFTTASGKRVSVTESSLERAKKLFSEDVTPLRSSENTGFSTASGKKVDVSEKSLLRAKMLFSEETSTPVRSDPQGFTTASGKRVSVTESSLERAKKLFSEDVTPLRSSENTGFSTASGKKVDVSEKALLRAKLLFNEEDPTPLTLESASFSIDSGKKCVNLNEEVFPKDSLGMGITSFADDAYAKHCDFSACVPSVAPMRQYSVDSHSNVESNSIISQSKSREGCSLVYSLKEVVPCDDHIDLLNSVNSKSDCRSLVEDNGGDSNFYFEKKAFAKCIHQFADSGRFKRCSSYSETNCEDIKKQCLHSPGVVLFPESQGDDYIKAVDVSVLSSGTCISTQNPPSPVFKTAKKRRFRMKRANVKGKKVIGSKSPAVPIFCSGNSLSGVSDGCDADFLSCKSSQSSSVITKEQGCDIKQKYPDLWDGDATDESWLGKQLELAEVSASLANEIGEQSDCWAEGRKAQEEIISSKGNIKPIVGCLLRVRRALGQQCTSLRDSVRGRRPGRYSKDHLRKCGIQESILNITTSNAADFRFKLQDYYAQFHDSNGVLVRDGFRLVPDEQGMFGATEAQAALLSGPGVDPKLLPSGGWCRNHYRWIIWKLASYERSFPQEFGGRCVTPENLICQLKYRWDREIDCGERPAIRKILEKDDAASKRMILCVSDIKKPALPVSSTKLEHDLIASSAFLELTDGWYSINGIIDSEMARLIQSGRLSVGTKIVTSGAELINGSPNGCGPLEPPASLARIRLSANSTRRARWDAKLGYVCNHPGPLPTSLHSLLPGGGAIAALHNVLLARIYPVVSVEKTSSGRKVVRSERAEARTLVKHEFERQRWLESVYADVSLEMQREQEEVEIQRRKGKRVLQGGRTSSRRSKQPRRDASLATEGSMPLHGKAVLEAAELSRLLEDSGDPSETLMTSSQLDMISAYRQESREQQQKELEERVRQRIAQEEEKLLTSGKQQEVIQEGGKQLTCIIKRDVTPLLKVRLVDADHPCLTKSAILSIWRPSEEVMSLFAKEGTIFNIYGLTSSGIRGAHNTNPSQPSLRDLFLSQLAALEDLHKIDNLLLIQSNVLQLSGGKQTRYRQKKTQRSVASLMESTYSSLKREVLSRGFDEHKFQLGPRSSYSPPPFGEIDVVAMVIRVGEELDRSRSQGFQHVYVVGSDSSILCISFWGGIKEFAVEEFLRPGSIVVALNLQLRQPHGLHRIPTAQAVETSTFTLNPGEERLKLVLNNFMIEIEAEREIQGNDTEFEQSCAQKLDAVMGTDCKGETVSPRPNDGPHAGTKQILLSTKSSTENLNLVRPSVAARMKKLQMYDGGPGISLPVCHLKNSVSVKKAFQPPHKCKVPLTSSSPVSKSVESLPDITYGQFPHSSPSEGKTVNTSLRENTTFQCPDADSPPMSLDSDPS